MSKKTTSYFWYSAQHSKHLASCRQFSNERFRRIGPTTVIIGGTRMEYTAARDDMASEPYDGALHSFPDYRFLGTSTWDTFKQEVTDAER